MANERETLLWDVKKACEELHLSRSKLLQLTYDGEIPSLTIGRRRMYMPKHLRRWASEKVSGGPLVGGEENELATWAEINDHGDRELRRSSGSEIRGQRGQA